MKRMLIGALLAMSLSAQAQGGGRKVAAAEKARTGGGADEIARLQEELAEQRALLVKVLEMERQHYDLLLKMVKEGKTGALVQPVTPVAVPEEQTPPPPVLEQKPVAKVMRKKEKERAPATGTVTGHVAVASAKKPAAVYVYVEDVVAPLNRGAKITIRQENKQFDPRVAVVQRGTTVEFPNYDAVFHNAFSLSAGNTFDLGTYRAGDETKSVVLTTPGVVDVFCNMHPHMQSSVLVVPSSLFAKVGADGSFRIDGVPAGNHRIVAWAPGAKLSPQPVEVNAGTASDVSLSVETADSGAHNNKFGQPYGSYKE